MGDRLRLVNIPDDGRAAVVVKDIADMASFFVARDSFQITAPKSSPITAQLGGRWGGSRPVGDTHDNGGIAWDLLVAGGSGADCIQKVEALLAAIDVVSPGNYLEWRPDGALYSVYYELRGPAAWNPTYRWVQFAGANSMVVQVSFPCAPLARGDNMDVWEPFSPRGSVLYTNRVTNPRAGVDTTGISNVTAPATVVQIVSGVPGGLQTGYEFAGNVPATLVAARLGITGSGAGAFPVTPGETLSASFISNLVSVSAGSVSGLRLRLLWFKSDGTASATVSSDGTFVNNPTIGADMTVVARGIVVPSDAAFCNVQVLLNTTNPTTFTLRFTGVLLVSGSTLPSYFDGSSDGGNWTGVSHASTSQLYSETALNDFTVDAGSKSNVASASGKLTAVANLATENRLAHTARGYMHPDGQYTVMGAPGATITNFKLGRYFKTAAGSYLEVYVDDDGVNSRLRVDKLLTSGRTNLASTNLAARVSNGTPLWVRGRIEGNVIYAEHFTSDPLAATAATTSTTPYTLSAAEAAIFGQGIAGTAGLVWTPQHAAAVVTDYRDEPYTFASRNFPDEVDLLAIPGTAPALMDLILEKPSGISAGFGCIGWDAAPLPFNLVGNGHFELDTAGWSVAAVTNINGTASSITRQTTGVVKYDAAAGEIVCPATSGTGANFPLYRRFRKGVTYTADIWVYSAAQVTSVSAVLGNSGANDKATSAGVALSPSYQKISVTWTPTADRDSAHVAAIINAATATTFRIDGVDVYEGTVAPTGKHAEGVGAVPPIGVVEAESCDAHYTTQWTPTASVNDRGGNVLRQALTTPNDYTAYFWVDPQLLGSDDFSEDLSVEFWGRFTLPTTLVGGLVNLSAQQIDHRGLVFGRTRYSLEFGGPIVSNIGHSIAAPTGAGVPVLTRLGTLVFPADQRRAGGRWLVAIAFRNTSTSSGNVDFDHFVMVPSRKRAATASGRQAANLASFLLSTASRKRVRSDLVTRSSRGQSAGEIADGSGLGGALLEPGPGNTRVALLIGGTGAPDAPAPDNGSNNDGSVANKTATLHASIIPRYRLGRGS